MSREHYLLHDPSLKKTDKHLAWLLAFLLFFLTNPYFFWKWYGNLFVTVLVSTITMILFWKYTVNLTKRQKSIYLIYIFTWSFYLLNEFFKGARLGVVAYFPYILLGLIPFVRKDFSKSVFEIFLTGYAIIIGLSMVSWIAAMTGIISPIGTIGEDNALLAVDKKTYLVYPLSLVSTRSIDEVIRFSAVFGEPGVVGTLGGLFLCAKRFNLKDWRCVIIMLSGLLSTSMFFYGLSFVYIMGELLFIKKKIVAILLIVFGVGIAYIVTKDNPTVSYLVWERFEWDAKKGDFKGNTRGTFENSDIIQNLKTTGEIWFGVKNKEAFWEEGNQGGTIFAAIAMWGLVLVIIYIFWLTTVGNYYKKNKWDFILYCFVIIGCIYQRPDLFSIPPTFLFICVARYNELQVGSATPHVIGRTTSFSARSTTSNA